MKYFFLGNAENTVKCDTWIKDREGVDFIRNEVNLMSLANLHQAESKLLRIHNTQRIVRIAVHKSLYGLSGVLFLNNSLLK